MFFQTSIGIDIRENKVFIVLLRGGLREITLIGHTSCIFDASLGLDEKIDRICDEFEAFAKSNPVNSTDIYVSIPRETAILKMIELPLAVKENLKAALTYEMEKYIPIPVGDIYFDCQVVEELPAKNRIRVLLVACKKKDVAAFITLGSRLGRGLTSLEISSTAIANYCAIHSEKKGESLYAALYKDDGRLEANLIKNRFLYHSRMTKAPNEGALPSILEALDTIQKEIANEPVKVTAACCGSISDETLQQVRDARPQITVRRLTPAMDALPAEAFIPACGLAAKGLKNVPMQINILPDNMRKRPTKLPQYLLLICTALLILSGAAWGTSVVVRNRQAADALNKEIRQLSAEMATIRQVQDEIDALDRQLTDLRSIQGEQTPIIDVLNELSRIIPKQAWVRRFTYDPKGITLDGYADASADLIEIIEASKMFKSVRFLATITKGKDGREHFKIGLELN